jgi:hypothetical protein
MCCVQNLGKYWAQLVATLVECGVDCAIELGVAYIVWRWWRPQTSSLGAQAAAG